MGGDLYRVTDYIVYTSIWYIPNSVAAIKEDITMAIGKIRVTHCLL